MKSENFTHSIIPNFMFDTPQKPDNGFYELCSGEKPLLLLFLSDFCHPVTQVYLARYLKTLHHLESGHLACVVHTDPESIAKLLHGADFPFPLICDAEGVLYDYFHIPECGPLQASLASRRILRDAAARGFSRPASMKDYMPLTLAVGPSGKILFAHHGTSLTDLPEDGEAAEAVCAHLDAFPAQPLAEESASV